IAEIFFGLAQQMRARLDADDMSGAGLERGKAPAPVMAAKIDDAAAGENVFVPADDGAPARIQARPRRDRFGRLQKARIEAAEFLPCHNPRRPSSSTRHITRQSRALENRSLGRAFVLRTRDGTVNAPQ